MRENLEKVAEKMIAWIGSINSLIVHTLLFISAFCLWFAGFDFEKILLVLTTIVSLEAIYLAIFIQMTVNKHARSLAAVEKDVDEIQENVEEIHEDIEEMQEEETSDHA